MKELTKSSTPVSDMPFRFCPYCGQKASTDFSFCPYCGKLLKLQSTPQSQPDPQPQPKPVVSPAPKPNAVKAYELRRTQSDNSIPDDGTGWRCGREYLLQAAKVVFGDDSAPFLWLPPGDDNRIAAICALARFVADHPEDSFGEGLSSGNRINDSFIITKYAVGFGHTVKRASHEDGHCGESLDIFYTTVQKCSAAEYLSARKQTSKVKNHVGQLIVSERFDIPGVQGSGKSVHYYENWCGLKGYYKIDDEACSKRPETPASIDEYSHWLCGKAKLLELSHIVFPENMDNPHELCALLEVMEEHKAWAVDWENKENGPSNKKRYEFNHHSVTASWSETDWSEDCYDGGSGGNVETWSVICQRVLSEVDRNEYEQARAVPDNILRTIKLGDGECLLMSGRNSAKVKCYYKDYNGLKGYYKLYESKLSLR